MKVSIKHNINENCVFVVVVCMVFLFGFVSFVRPPRKTSNTENRNLSRFSVFNVKDFLNGSFQDNFENALSDQFPFSEKIRIIYGSAMANMPDYGISKMICSNHYTALPNDTSNRFRLYNCGDYILRPVELPNEGQAKVLEQNISKFNRINEIIPAYYYIINTSATYDFEKNERAIDYEDILSEKMKGNYKIASLKYDSYEEYKNYFYKTDHRWNYKGSYQGFLDIADMFGIKNPMEPVGTFTNNEYFFGTSARSLRKFDGVEDFTIYAFNIPEHYTVINAVSHESYNHIDDYINHNYEYSSGYRFYANIYGNDCGEILFDFNNPKKDNLLMIVDSFSNPINELIAQYFNKTYVVDLRRYKKYMNKDFALSSYLKEKKIDKILLIMSSEYFLLDDDTTKGLEK